MNFFADAKSNDDKIVKPEPAEEIIIPPKNEMRYYGKMEKMEHYEMSKLLNDSSVSKFVTKNGSK